MMLYLESNTRPDISFIVHQYAGSSSNKNSDRPPRKCFRCGSEDHLIAKCPKPPKDSEKRRMFDKSKEKGNSAKYNSDDDDDLKVYAYMARMSNDNVRENKYYGDSSQLTNWILDSGATCHMMQEVTDFITGSLEDTDKFIEVVDGHHVTAKQKVSVRIQMFDDNTETLSRGYIAYYWHQTCVTDYFPSLR